LGPEELGAIVDIQIAQLAARLAARRLTLEVSDAAREWLALSGFDPLYGARPLRRLIQSSIGDQLAKSLLAGEILDGEQVQVDIDRGSAQEHPDMAAADATRLVVRAGRPVSVSG
ncbi:MAG: ATP-dependent chaperone ClpB, partial [Gordonia polyisoprenivorans]|nr:ATP-dependent chaperone ClpB [Gordonia polyisoprenivorans]